MPLFPLLWKGEAYLNTFWNWTKEHKIKVIFYLLFFLLSNYVSSFFSTYTGTFFNKLSYLTSHLTVIFEAFPIALTIKDLGLALGVTSVLILLVSQKEENNKTYRKGVEHGSATWGNPNKDLEEANLHTSAPFLLFPLFCRLGQIYSASLIHTTSSHSISFILYFSPSLLFFSHFQSLSLLL